MLLGVPPQRSTLINASRIGTDQIFAQSALVAQRDVPMALGAHSGQTGS